MWANDSKNPAIAVLARLALLQRIWTPRQLGTERRAKTCSRYKLLVRFVLLGWEGKLPTHEHGLSVRSQSSSSSIRITYDASACSPYIKLEVSLTLRRLFPIGVLHVRNAQSFVPDIHCSPEQRQPSLRTPSIGEDRSLFQDQLRISRL